MRELRGRNAILTGASRGLGSHLARALAREGVNLALAARSADALERVRNDVRSNGVTAVAVQTDLADAAQVDRLARAAEAELGPIDILVNNAGVEHTAPYQDQPVDRIEAAVRVNLLAAMLLTRAVLPGMIDRKRGHVVNISSLAGKIGAAARHPVRHDQGSSRHVHALPSGGARGQLGGGFGGVPGLRDRRGDV